MLSYAEYTADAYMYAHALYSCAISHADMPALSASLEFMSRAVGKLATDTNSDVHRAVHAALRDATSFTDAFPAGTANDDRFLLFLSKWVDRVKQVSLYIDPTTATIWCFIEL
jgi:hypothetical protein